MEEWKTQCACNQLPNTVQEAESYLKKHHELSDDISQIYSEVNNPQFFFYLKKNGKRITREKEQKKKINFFI